MPRAQRGVAVNNTITEINILNIFASSFVSSCLTGPGRLEGEMGWAQPAHPGEKPTGMWLEGPWQKGTSGNVVRNGCIRVRSGKGARRWESWAQGGPREAAGTQTKYAPLSHGTPPPWTGMGRGREKTDKGGCSFVEVSRVSLDKQRVVRAWLFYLHHFAV